MSHAAMTAGNAYASGREALASLFNRNGATAMPAEKKWSVTYQLEGHDESDTEIFVGNSKSEVIDSVVDAIAKGREIKIISVKRYRD